MEDRNYALNKKVHEFSEIPVSRKKFQDQNDYSTFVMNTVPK